MILLTNSITLTAHVNLTISGVANLKDRDTVVDGNLRTFASTTDPSPQFIMNFGRDKKATADAIFVKGWNLASYTVATKYDDMSTSTYSNIPNSTQTIPANDHSYSTFDERSAQYWRVSFTKRTTGVCRIHEIYLMEKLVDFDNAEDRPIRIRTPKTRGTFYRTESGALAWFEPEGFSLGKATITLEWENLANDKVEKLKSVWERRLSFDKLFTVYPRPPAEPKNIYYARWENDFQFSYSGSRIADGQSGNIIFREL